MLEHWNHHKILILIDGFLGIYKALHTMHCD